MDALHQRKGSSRILITVNIFIGVGQPRIKEDEGVGCIWACMLEHKMGFDEDLGSWGCMLRRRELVQRQTIK